MNATPGRAKIAKGNREARGIRSLEMPPEMLNSNLGEQIYICLKQKTNYDLETIKSRGAVGS